MGNRASRSKSQKSHKSSKKDENQAMRTRSLNSLPIDDRSPSKPKPTFQSVRERKCVVSEQCLDTEVSKATRHRRQNTAPEINVHSTPRSLKISDFSKVIQQPEPPQEEVEFNIPIEKALEPTPDELCEICSVFTGKIKFLCRICYQVYHLGCLQKVEQHEPSPVVCYLNRADTEIGWSCHKCDNVSRLLTESEMALLIYTLEQYNIRQGSSIFRQQFLYYKKAAFRDRAREEMPQDKLTDERCVFDKLDKKHTGRISWEDFINSEAINMLRNRPKRKLVKLLTQAELFRCRQKFMEYDHDKDGEITRFESLKSQMKSYSDLNCFPTPTPSKLLYSNEEIGGVINWMEFLQHQAVTVIAARRNSFCREQPKVASESPKIPPRTPEVITRQRTNFVDPEVRNTLTERVPALNTLTVITPVSSRSASPIPIGTVDVKSSTQEPVIHVDEPKALTTVEHATEPTPPPPVLMRSGRSKSAIVRSRAEKSPSLTKPIVRLCTTKSVDESAVENDISNGNLIKSPNVNLLEDSTPHLLRSTQNDICEVSMEKPNDEENVGVSINIIGSPNEASETKDKDSEKLNSPDTTKLVDDKTDEEKNERDSVNGEVDVVRRFPKSARNHTISMYIYESNRNTFGNEIRSIRRPVSVVGFKMEPTETVSRLSMNLKRPASSPHHSILPLIRKEIKNNGSPSKQPLSPTKNKDTSTKSSNKENQSPVKIDSPRTSVSKIPPALKQDSDNTHNMECDVERRGRKRLNDYDINLKSDGKYRSSDSEVLKAEKIPKANQANRSQTASLFVTRNERALLIDQSDRRPLSLG